MDRSDLETTCDLISVGNLIVDDERSSMRDVPLGSWQDRTLAILIIAAVASLGIKEGWYDWGGGGGGGGAGGIAFAVILVIVAISDYRQSLHFQDLNEEKTDIRLEVDVKGGRRREVSIYDAIVGDVVLLKIGDQVPADRVLISGHSLAIDKSSMNGECKIVHKDAREPFLMSGCKVADGNGTMIVTSVGINIEWGLPMASISEDTGEETPLQVSFSKLFLFFSLWVYYFIVGLHAAVAVLAILQTQPLCRFFTGYTKNPNGTIQFKAGKTIASVIVDGVIEKITAAVTIVAVAVPKGLHLAAKLILLDEKMMVEKAMVRRLSECPTMGFATTICSHKTGTLTSNQMTVVEAYAGGRKVDPPDSTSKLSTSLISLLIEAIAQNYAPETMGDVELSASPTGKAILRWGIKLEMEIEVVRSSSSIIHVFPFSSEKKQDGQDSEVRMQRKGAAEIVLAFCTMYKDANDQVVAMDKDQKMYFRKTIEDMATDSLCCVAIAYRSYDIKDIPLDKEHNCFKMQMLDPEADAIAPNLIKGKTFRSLSAEEREEVAEKISMALLLFRVMGRSSPNDKLLVVQALGNSGRYWPCNGIQGMEVAKELSDIIMEKWSKPQYLHPENLCGVQIIKLIRTL
ncbi:hypothetical protein ACJRO7_027228 [Eucalyptus globulus]|uniref:P-type ATPase A domain-containing protein n=1 Tax=Eucalyptus globulus TaxID=34317 RepID=A0ABD3JVF3_EUCGL